MTEITSSAYFLVAHGSRNPNYLLQLQNLAILIQQEINISNKYLPIVKTGYLELAKIPLFQSIINFALELSSQGNYQSIKIIPLFLSSGVHVKQDIPREIQLARKHLKNNHVSLQLMPFLGSHDNLLTVLERKFAQFNTQKKILLAHGSSLEQSNQECQKIATQLDVDLTYWSINPKLNEKIASLSNSGVDSVAIIPYFLFEGRITRAIADNIKELKAKYAHLKLYLDSPIGVSQDLANLIIKLAN